ncbi:hypothetical protein [Dyadobacter frigoris]|nr:hypothetical protein [Dyadobacter frigoris]
METHGKDNKSKSGLWEVLTIVFVWLVVLSMVYIIFWKAKSNLN